VCKTKESDDFVKKMAEDKELKDILYCSRAPLDETVNELGDANGYKRYVSICCYHTSSFWIFFAANFIYPRFEVA
jgi:hypothetical protein